MSAPGHSIADELAYRARAVWVAAKQTLGLPRRGDATFYVDRFDRALRSGRIGGNFAILATGKDDGAGSQAQAAMSALCFAKAHGLPYIHRPFHSIEHAETDMPAWIAAWETYFNLGAFERQLSAETAPIVPLDRLPLVARNAPVIVAAEHYLRYCNRDGQAWERVLPLLRAKFWENKQRQRTPGEIRLAIHMRRGDVSSANKKVANNFTPNATFVNTLTRLKAVLGDRAPALRVEVFSQGDPATFADLAALGAKLRLDEPALDTHRALVESDILVMSKGAYSYTAAVLHEGLVLYDPQKYRPLQEWVVRAPDGTFDEALVARSLARLLGKG
ncbi:MAG: hypothetical protein H7Y62_15495 [Hyphomicrobium sp.]|nr:hypothetical protein [Hyphomicrobium sp.]